MQGVTVPRAIMYTALPRAPLPVSANGVSGQSCGFLGSVVTSTVACRDVTRDRFCCVHVFNTPARFQGGATFVAHVARVVVWGEQQCRRRHDHLASGGDVILARCRQRGGPAVHKLSTISEQ